MADRRQEDYDRDFTAMVSGLRMEGLPPLTPVSPSEPPDLRAPAEEARPAEPDDREEAYLPEPLPPLSPPGGWALVGWVCAGCVLSALVLTIAGVRLPAWAGWLVIAAFVAAIVIGWRSLPKDRDPGAGDGAVL